MAERVTVFWQGKEYDAVRSGARDGQPADELAGTSRWFAGHQLSRQPR